MLDMKLNGKRLAMHWHYYRARYVVFLILALAASNFLLSATTPKTPPDRKVDVFIISPENSDQAEIWQKSLLCLLPPRQREVNLLFTPMVPGQESQIYQLLGARMAAQEGSVWILPADMFLGYAQQGAFKQLDGEMASFDLPEGVRNSSAGKARAEDGTQHQYGLPLDASTGLATLLFEPKGLVLGFPAYTDVNYESAKVVANYLIGRTGAVLENPAPADTGFGFYAASYSFGSQDTSAWSAAIKAKLNTDPGVFLVPYAMGREPLVAEQLRERVKYYPSGMFIVPRAVFTALARSGALAPLDGAAGRLNVPEGTDLAAGRESATGKDGKPGPEQLYGIPLDNCPTLYPVVNPRGMMLAFPALPDERLTTAIDAANAVLEKAK